MSDPFTEFKNPDGTYDGLKMMACLSGLSEDEVKTSWDKVKKAKEDARKRD